MVYWWSLHPSYNICCNHITLQPPFMDLSSSCHLAEGTRASVPTPQSDSTVYLLRQSEYSTPCCFPTLTWASHNSVGLLKQHGTPALSALDIFIIYETPFAANLTLLLHLLLLQCTIIFQHNTVL